MVYIYKKKSGERTYYYLRASERKEGKIVVKDIAYLGDNIDQVRKKLESLPKYSQQIRKAYRTIHNFLESNRYMEKVKSLKLKKDTFLGERGLEIEAAKWHYNQEFKKSPELTQKETFKNFIVEFAFNTAAIEGNTIKLVEARRLLEEGKTPKDKDIREVYDLQNTERVLFHILNSKDEINHEFIINIHKNLMQNIDVRTGYRNVDVRVIKANFKATPAPYVKTDMNLLLNWYHENKNNLHPLVLASLFHHKFERIHPFMDGNGRAGRMLLNYILVKNNYPPLVIHTKKRTSYLDSLRVADKCDLFKFEKEFYQKLIDFISDEMIETYWNIFL